MFIYKYMYNEIGSNGNETFRLSLFTRFLTDTGIYTKKTNFSQVGANAQ